MRGQLRNQLHALQQGPVVVTQVRTRMQALDETLTAQIAEVEAELASVLPAEIAEVGSTETSPEQSWARSVALLQTIPGIGLLTAMWIVVATVNFTICTSAEQAVAYAGLAPVPYQSGTSVHARPRIGQSGNGRLRTALYLATLSAARFNPIIKRFYDRLRAQGKPAKVARCAAARKLMHLAFAVATHQKEFDPDYQSKPQVQTVVS
jgi:transposase